VHFPLVPDRGGLLGPVVTTGGVIDASPVDEEVRRRLGEMLPEALLFSDNDRTLPSTFTLSEDALLDVPASVQNLADMAGLSLSELLSEVEDGDRAVVGPPLAVQRLCDS
jgi:hypothetical protein